MGVYSRGEYPVLAALMLLDGAHMRLRSANAAAPAWSPMLSECG
jgi:hypothetical protein